MAWHLIKTGQDHQNFEYKEFMLDAESDILIQPTEFGPIGVGSVAYICSDNGNALSKIWMLNANKKWLVLNTGGSGGGGSSSYADRAGTADRLTYQRKIGLAGDATGQVLFDGSQDASIVLTNNKISNEELEEMLK